MGAGDAAFKLTTGWNVCNHPCLLCCPAKALRVKPAGQLNANHCLCLCPGFLGLATVLTGLYLTASMVGAYTSSTLPQKKVTIGLAYFCSGCLCIGNN